MYQAGQALFDGCVTSALSVKNGLLVAGDGDKASIGKMIVAALSLDRPIEKQANESFKIQIVTGIIVTFIGFIVIWIFAVKLIAPIKNVVTRLKSIASGEGDLTQRLNVKSNDEVGELAICFNRFLDKLQGTIKEVIESADAMSQTSQQAREIAVKSRQSSEAQFREVDMVTTASEEMTKTSAVIVDNAGSAVKIASQAEQSVHLCKSWWKE